MSVWTNDELNKIGTAEELQIAYKNVTEHYESR